MPSTELNRMERLLLSTCRVRKQSLSAHRIQRMKPVLNEMQDRMLAMADDEWMDLATAKSILESWFDVSISTAELGLILCKLLELQLISCTVKFQAVTAATLNVPDELSLVEFKSTGMGLRYLSGS